MPALFFRVNVVPVTVELCTASLNVPVIEAVVATPVAPLVGLVLTTVGAVVSAAAAVVNDQTLAVVIALPARSFTPVVIVAVYDVEAARDELGFKVAVLASVLSDSVPEIRVPA